jgi:hypothetical protein
VKNDAIELFVFDSDLTVLLYQEINIQAIVIYGLGSAEIRFVQLVILVNRVIDRNDAIALVAFTKRVQNISLNLEKQVKLRAICAGSRLFTIVYNLPATQ